MSHTQTIARAAGNVIACKFVGNTDISLDEARDYCSAIIATAIEEGRTEKPAVYVAPEVAAKTCIPPAPVLGAEYHKPSPGLPAGHYSAPVGAEGKVGEATADLAKVFWHNYGRCTPEVLLKDLLQAQSSRLAEAQQTLANIAAVVPLLGNGSFLIDSVKAVVSRATLAEQKLAEVRETLHPKLRDAQEQVRLLTAQLQTANEERDGYKTQVSGWVLIAGRLEGERDRLLSALPEVEGALELLINQTGACDEFRRTFTPQSRATASAALATLKAALAEKKEGERPTGGQP